MRCTVKDVKRKAERGEIMLHTINIYVWGTPATISISDDVLRWIYIADSVGLHRHRIVLLTRYIIKNKKFKIDDKKHMQQEKQFLDTLNKAVKRAGEIMFKQCRTYDTFDLHSACNAISKCESVNSKYYIHKYKGVSKNEQFTEQYQRTHLYCI